MHVPSLVFAAVMLASLAAAQPPPLATFSDGVTTRFEHAHAVTPLGRERWRDVGGTLVSDPTARPVSFESPRGIEFDILFDQLVALHAVRAKVPARASHIRTLCRFWRGHQRSGGPSCGPRRRRVVYDSLAPAGPL